MKLDKTNIEAMNKYYQAKPYAQENHTSFDQNL